VLAGLSRKAAATLLVVAMAVAAMTLWVGIPLGWLWIGSQLVDSSQPSLGPYMVVVVGIIASVIADALLISRLNRKYQSVTGGTGHVRVQLPWMKSMRGERERPREMSVLDAILIGTVILAGLTAFLWFVLLAGSPLPGG
jgi:multisubunit Na+/H+ antiporter MnhB subunit